MELWLGGVYSLITLAMIGVILLVLRHDYVTVLNRSFAAFLSGIVLWSVLNYLSNLHVFSLGMLDGINRLLMFVASVLVVLILHFCAELVEMPKRMTFKALTMAIGVANGVLAASPLVVSSLSYGDNVVAINFGPAAWLCFLIIILMSCSMFGVLIYAIYKRRGIKRQRAVVMLTSLLLTVVSVLITSAVVPYITGNFMLSLFGPIFPLILLGGTGYAIVKHRLFDVRIIAARSLAYVLSILIIAIVYTGIVYGLLGSVLRIQMPDSTTNFAYIFIAIIIALTFQPVRRFFDRVSDSVFFRGEYTPQVVLNQLGAVFANEINLSKMATSSLRVIATALKSEYAYIVLLPRKDVDHQYQFRTGKVTARFETVLESDFLAELAAMNEQIITRATDRLPVKRRMKAGGVALILRLETARELVGFLLLGEKQDDSFYNSKDTTMLSTVGYELGLAVQNGLRFQEIQAFNATLQEKVEEATYQLRQSNRKLQALDQAKDEFISMASHQLRTPLTSVKGYLSMVIDGDAGSLKDDQSKLLGEAYASAERMVYLISDFLNISRIRTGKFVLESKPVNLASIISSEIGQLGNSARNRKLQLVYDPPANFPIGVLDEEKLRQVIMNFIDNAIYYTPAGGKIAVTLTATAKDIIFRVTDTGIGVPPSERHKLFTKFYRATNAKHIRPDGTGIGLFMAKKVITMHGGSIIFETSEGKGSTFGFSIPLHHPKPKK